MSREILIRRTVDRFIARMREQTDAQLEALATELLQIVQGDMRTGRADVDRAAVEVARAVAKGGSHARHDLMSRLVAAVRRLDDAATLRGVLDALADGAAAEAARVAIFTCDQQVLRSYRHSGYGLDQAPTDLRADVVPLLANVIATRQPASLEGETVEGAQGCPAWMRPPAGRVGRLIPILLGAQVAAVLYADGPDRPADQPGAAVWTEQVEVLVRHASARLESVTSQRAVEALAGPGS
jgi:hypothetical protein